MPFLPSIFKSVQSGTINLGSGLTASVAITTVDLNHSVILFNGAQGNDFSGFVAGSQWCYFDFPDSTHVRANRGDSNSGSATLIGSYIVLEFYGGFLRQNVKFMTAGGAHGLTLGSKAFVVFSGWSSNLFPTTSNDQGVVNAYITLTGTNINTGLGSTVTAFGAFIVDPH